MNWRSFLILHGVENWRPGEHWNWWLAHEVRAQLRRLEPRTRGCGWSVTC
jgi:hypothetical protein